MLDSLAKRLDKIKVAIRKRCKDPNEMDVANNTQFDYVNVNSFKRIPILKDLPDLTSNTKKKHNQFFLPRCRSLKQSRNNDAEKTVFDLIMFL